MNSRNLFHKDIANKMIGVVIGKSMQPISPHSATMRRARLKAEVAYYHCVSRVVGRAFLLGDEEKDQLVELMRVYERLYGLRVIAYCIMSNHFHLLVEVPRRPDEAELVAKVRACLGDQAADCRKRIT